MISTWLREQPGLDISDNGPTFLAHEEVFEGFTDMNRGGLIPLSLKRQRKLQTIVSKEENHLYR